MHVQESQYPISVVEQETGISKELLRMWERRYNFPVPDRDSSGNRIYNRAQIDRLQSINKLLAAGYRPGFVVGANDEKLGRLLQELPSGENPSASSFDNAPIERLWQMFSDLDFPASQRLLRQYLASEGVRKFIAGIAAPLQQELARAALSATLPDFVCHIARELLSESLHLAISMLPTPDSLGLRILLIDLPGENRPLELLMTRVLLLSSGAEVLFLGAEPAVEDVLECLGQTPVPVLQVAISASSINSANQKAVQRMRAEMPASTSLWLSGSGAEEIDLEASGPRFRRLQDLLRAVDTWQAPMRTT